MLQLLVPPAALLPFNLIPLEASSPSRRLQQAYVVCLWQNQERKGEIRTVATPRQVTIQSISGNLCIKSLLLYFATKATAFPPSCCVIFIAGKISAPKSTAHLCHPGALNACELSQRQSSAKHAVALVMAVLSAVTDTSLQPYSIKAETQHLF